MTGRRRYSSIWHAIMRGDEIETDTDETRATWRRPYNRDEDNVRELPPPHVMQAQVMGDELIERDEEDKQTQEMTAWYIATM